MRFRHAALAAAAVLAAPPAAAYVGQIVCSSIEYRPAVCPADTQGHVVILRELSSGNLCQEGRTWGFDHRGIWVTNGCRAEFAFGRPAPAPPPPVVVPAPSFAGAIACASIDYQPAVCPVDTQGHVVMLREVSSGNLCHYGRTWGFDARGIWVSHGCRAEFGFGRAAAPLPAPPVAAPGVPAWAVGTFLGLNPDSSAQARLVIGPEGRVTMRDERDQTLQEGNLRQGTIYWIGGRRSWLNPEPTGVTLGDPDSGRTFFFQRG